jgi:N-acylglucosamine 2-epimerase
MNAPDRDEVPDPAAALERSDQVGAEPATLSLRSSAATPDGAATTVAAGLRPDAALGAFYRRALLEDTIPFWLRHGLDREHGGLLTGLGRDGTVIDTDKAIWLQGRAAWTLATLCNTIEARPEWRDAAVHCLDFIRAHARGPGGKLYFTVTRDGRPLRMRRYVYSECFAAIGSAAAARATGAAHLADEAREYWATYLHHSFTPGVMPPKTDPAVRPMRGLAPLMITISTAQELRENLGDFATGGRTCAEWIEWAIGEIEREFFKPELGALLEVVAPGGGIIDHFDGRTLNPGHAIECAWFILHEARRRGHAAWRRLGLAILDGMWARGWDAEHGGLLYFVDVHGKPVQEYWAEMKFWWPHNEAVIATLLAWRMTGEAKYARWHRDVHDWAHRVFADPEHGEWFGYADRAGRITTRLKGNTWKGPFHLPRMQWYGARLLAEEAANSGPGGDRVTPSRHPEL